MACAYECLEVGKERERRENVNVLATYNGNKFSSEVTTLQIYTLCTYICINNEKILHTHRTYGRKNKKLT